MEEIQEEVIKRGRGRPKRLGERKSILIRVREDVRDRITEAVAASGQTLNGWAESALDKAAFKRTKNANRLN